MHFLDKMAHLIFLKMEVLRNESVHTPTQTSLIIHEALQFITHKQTCREYIVKFSFQKSLLNT